ncbi:MAG: B12-binding domain-containing radical SAM protein [Candidatus Bathyarchaeota archaeon]|nr:B12-binding domain-containing radical SAM protein [Candidatus Bathyarchaeota archaeon]
MSSETCLSFSVGGMDCKGEVLLVYPGKYHAPDPQVPLALLYLASALQKEGFAVRLFDMRLNDYRRLNVGTPVFVGISAMSGAQIKYALKFAEHVRKQDSSVPLVWGGVHPTLLPEQTAASDLVDVVVRGEADLTIGDLANALSEKRSLDEVAGVTYKVNGVIQSNHPGKLVDLDEIPVDLPYNLLELERYPSFRAGRFHIQTSRGCPHRCGFCYNTKFNHNKWRGKSSRRVLEEIAYIKHAYPHIKIIDPIDDNVFVDEFRIQEICQGLIKQQLGVHWRGNCRFDYLANYSRGFLELLEQSGCVELDFGGESGSERLQQLICKDVTVEDMLVSVDNLRRFAPSIEPYVSWMSGLPEESDADLAETFDLMDRLKEVNPKTQHYGIFVYTPFPSSLTDGLVEFTAPQSLEEWGNIEVFRFNAPWHSKSQLRRLHTISAVTRIAFYPHARINERDIVFKAAYTLINKIEKYRWRHRAFWFPLEITLVDALSQRFKGFL